MRKNSGFTAMELAVTLAVMVVVAAFVMPPYLKWLRAYRLRGAVNNLIADFEMAKIRAIRENSFVAVLFQSDKYVIFVDNGEGTGGSSGDWIRNGDEILIRSRPLPAGVTFDMGGLTLADDRVRFNGRGFPPDVFTEEAIPLLNRSGNKQIVMNRLGHLYVQKTIRKPMQSNDNRFTTNQSGFSLIELLIAMAILAVGMLAAASMQYSSIRNNTKGNVFTQANMLAKAQLEALKSRNVDDLVPGSYSDTASLDENGQPGGIYNRSWNIANFGGQSRRLTVTVQWTRKGVSDSVEISSNTRGNGV